MNPRRSGTFGLFEPINTYGAKMEEHRAENNRRMLLPGRALKSYVAVKYERAGEGPAVTGSAVAIPWLWRGCGVASPRQYDIGRER